MAGIGSIYYLGSSGGFLGSDGLYNTDLKIEVWHGHMMTLVAKYKTNTYEPMYMALNRFVPNGPNDKDMLRRALILFASNLFKDCPSYQKVKLECDGLKGIDFSSGENVPRHFNDLLEESSSIDISDKVSIYESYLNEVYI